ncbi:winged helix-turn-helix domain-containing protein [Pantoea sp. FN0302]|uniref:winged helix-turn-helix domain-containing protein n=1 Tax=unclassified Pantoea TaxID=2630326 RepID=UPI003CF691D3
MGPVYLIHESIYFYPKNHRLVCHSQGKEDTSLTQPATKCLELLIKTHGLVSQNDLYDYAWGENSHNVSPNTLYQNISLIRRALKNIMPGADRWIITVPRKGFRFDHSISTKLQSTEEILPAIIAAPTFRIEPQGNAAQFKTLIPVSFFLLCCSLLFFVNSVNADFKKFMGSYDKIAEYGACQLYVSRNDLPLKEKIDNTLSQYIDCKAYPHVYITYDRFIKHISFFSCQNPLNEDRRSCTSWSLGKAI